MSSLERKPSISTEDLTPIVLNQLQSTNRKKEEVKKFKKGGGSQHLQHELQARPDAASKAVMKSDSEANSCGEEGGGGGGGGKRTAAAFMSEIQSALQDLPDHKEGLSQELVSEVDSVLSKLMCSASKGDPSLIPLITSLQASLRTTKEVPRDHVVVVDSNKLKLSQSHSGSLSSENSPGTPSQKEWMKDPFGKLPRRPQASNEERDFEPVEAKTFEPKQGKSRTNQVSELSGSLDCDNELPYASKIPWKIRAARKRAVKHHTTGMTKDEFAKIMESLKHSDHQNVNVKPENQMNSLVRNKSESSIAARNQRGNADKNVGDENSRQPSTNDNSKQCDTNRSSDLGYASDICDYNIAPKQCKDPPIREDTDYIQQKRPGLMNDIKEEGPSTTKPVTSIIKSDEEKGQKLAARSSSGVRAKIARRKLMRQANAIDNPQGSLSDQEDTPMLTNEEDENDSIEEKQDSEPINEKEQKWRKTVTLLAPEMAGNNWSSRFSNIKNSFDNQSEEDPSSKSRSPSVNRSHHNQDRGRARQKREANPNPRSKSAHSVNQLSPNYAIIDYGKNYNVQGPTSKADKNKLNTIKANQVSSNEEVGYLSDNVPEVKMNSGRDSVDYHQYLEMIERFRGNNPKVYSRPLQKSVPTTFSYSRLQKREPIAMQPTVAAKEQVSLESKKPDIQSKAESMGLVKSVPKTKGTNKNNDMDYNEYMNLINKVRRTKEFTRVRTEQIRLASMYAQEKKRQEELTLEEKRLENERKLFEKEREAESSRRSSISQINGQVPALGKVNSAAWGNNHTDMEKSDEVASPKHEHNHIAPPNDMKVNPVDTENKDLNRLYQIRQERLEQKQQEQLRELQVKAEQEKLVQLRRDQLKQEKEREEIQRLEHERLLQIQEDHERLLHEQQEEEYRIRMEQIRLEEEKRRQEKLQAEKNALYNKQRLDIEAKNVAQTGFVNYREMKKLTEPKNEDNNLIERYQLQEKLKDDHKREEKQIRQEKLNLIQQEEALLLRQEEMLKQMEEERRQLTKQEQLIRSRQQSRLEQVRQEKQLLEKQQDMLRMREEQLNQERLRHESLRNEQRALKEQEEAIKRRQEEITKELLMSDLSDTGSETITMCWAREAQPFKGTFNKEESALLPYIGEGKTLGETEKKSETEEDTLDENEDYYESTVEVTQCQTSVPKSVRTIETKIDNPPWAPITPYLNYFEKQEADDMKNYFQGPVPYSNEGIITSPDSVATSTCLMTTPENSVQSQTSLYENPSGPSSCPQSPPPLPPLPATTNGIIFDYPEAPQRTDSFAIAAGLSNSKAMPYLPHQQTLTCRYSPEQNMKIGGPGSAFKPYTLDDLVNANRLTIKQPSRKMNSESSPIYSVSGRSVRNGDIHDGLPVFSKIRGLQRQMHPFSTTDTEPDMKECIIPQTEGKGRRAKVKVPNYSTSETEEEYLNYLRLRPKWHGKGGHKDSWDPLLIESPPQITQKPVGLIQKPTPHAPDPITRGTVIKNEVEMTNYAEENQNPDDIDYLTPSMPALEYIQKSDSVVEVRKANVAPAKSGATLESKDQSKFMDIPNKEQRLFEPSREPVKSHKLNEKETSTDNNASTLTPWVKRASQEPQNDMKEKDMTPNEMKNIFKRQLHPIQRVNPTIAAMEIMTRKELKLGEMEQRLAKEKASNSTRAPPKLAWQKQESFSKINQHKDSTSKVKPMLQRLVVFSPKYAKQRTPIPVLQVDPWPVTVGSILFQAVSTKMQNQVVKPHPLMVEGRLHSQVTRLPSSQHPEVQHLDSPLIVRKKMQPDVTNVPNKKKLVAEVKPQVPRESVEKDKRLSSKMQHDDSGIEPIEKVNTSHKKPSTAFNLQSLKTNSNDDSSLPVKTDVVKKAAEKFETSSRKEKAKRIFSSSDMCRAKSKSIGNNLSQRLVELEEDKSRIEESLNQTKMFLPWTSQQQANNKAPVLKKRDAFWNKKHGYELRQSKSSDSITAAKMLAEERMRNKQQNQARRSDFSKSIEQQIDVYTKTKEDIRKILQLAKDSSVSERIKLFNTQRPVLEQDKEDLRRQMKADAIRREIEDAKSQVNETVEEEPASSQTSLAIQEPVEAKVKPLKIHMKSKLIPQSSQPLGVAGSKLRINQKNNQDTETKSILRNSKERSSDCLVETEQRRLSIENIPSIRSKIDEYLQQAEESKSLHANKLHAEKGGKKTPKLLQSHHLSEGAEFQIYAQSATDYSATEDEEEKHNNSLPKVGALKVPENCSLKKSKSFAGQFECDIDESKLQDKQRTMLAFFSNSPQKSPSPSNVRQEMKESSNGVLRQSSITDDILVEEDLFDVEAMFESLLNNTFEEGGQPLQQNRSETPNNKTDPDIRSKANLPSTLNRSSLNGLLETQEQQVPNDSNDTKSSSCVKHNMDSFSDNPNAADSKKKGLARQQTWAGYSTTASKVARSTLSPSPTQSDYDTCYDNQEET